MSQQLHGGLLYQLGLVGFRRVSMVSRVSQQVSQLSLRVRVRFRVKVRLRISIRYMQMYASTPDIVQFSLIFDRTDCEKNLTVQPINQIPGNLAKIKAMSSRLR